MGATTAPKTVLLATEKPFAGSAVVLTRGGRCATRVAFQPMEAITVSFVDWRIMVVFGSDRSLHAGARLEIIRAVVEGVGA